MKKLLFFLLFCSFTFAQQAIVVDPDFSPYSGAPNLLTAHWLLRSGEDAWFEGGHRDRTSRVWGRALEQILFWYPINNLASVTQHEVFGHGYRLRELDNSPKRYSISPLGDGATYFEVNVDFPIGKMLAVSVAGLEAEAILARFAKMHFIKDGKIDGRISSLYTTSQQSLFWYTIITQLGRLKGNLPSSGNDVERFIELINTTYPDDHLTLGQLTRWSLLNLIDPMTFFAYFAWFYYIAENKPWEFPMITISDGIRYLPNIRIAYAPYGPEAYLEHFFSIHGDPLYVYMKGGPRNVGLGIAYDHLFSGKIGIVGIRFDAWMQNQFISNRLTIEDLEKDTVPTFISNVFNIEHLKEDIIPTTTLPELKQKRWGVALSLTSTLNLSSYLGLFAELGGKTKGYLAGYPLDSSITARIGLVLGKKQEEKSNFN